ncbi:MAG: SipW-dependent-type signal peptide-containing protein [Bifidobacteriaceae bacterium]|jgi:predicted ribosomally synthesized peptide with SipW-like signal peptide|nr:SipW-dependent-type signal peptide-containing protein [Bifidobacteriaceae bacterium]
MATSHTRARRVKGLVAGACGTALLMAGGTWALWYDEAKVNGGWITAGNLDLAKAGAETVYDISTTNGYNNEKHEYTGQDAEPRTDEVIPLAEKYDCLGTDYKDVPGHEADLSGLKGLAWTASPGDTLVSVWPYYVALQGDNMVAELKLAIDTDKEAADVANGKPKADAIAEAFSDFKISVLLNSATSANPEDYKWSKEPLFDSTTISGADAKAAAIKAVLAKLTNGQFYADENNKSIKLQAANESDGKADPNIRVVKLNKVPAAPAATADAADIAEYAKGANACVVLEGTFDVKTSSTADGDGNLTADYAQQNLLVLPDLKVTLEQTRARGTGNFPK